MNQILYESFLGMNFVLIVITLLSHFWPWPNDTCLSLEQFFLKIWGKGQDGFCGLKLGNLGLILVADLLKNLEHLIRLEKPRKYHLKI